MSRFPLMIALCAATCWSAAAFGQAAQAGNPQRQAAVNRAANALSNALLQPYANQFTEMSEQLTLTDEEKTTVKAEIELMNKELQEFVQNAQQEMRQNIRAANKGGGKGAKGGAGAGVEGKGDQLRDQLDKALSDFQTLADTHEIKIDADLAPEQRESWEIYRLNHQLLARLVQLDLDDDQMARVKDAVDAAGKEIAGATDPKDLPPIRGKLAKKLVADILTDDQAAKLFAGAALRTPGQNQNAAGIQPGKGGLLRRNNPPVTPPATMP